MTGWLATVVLLAGFGRWYQRRVRDRRRQAAELDEVVAFVDELLRQVRSGASLTSGFRAAGDRRDIEALALVKDSRAAGRRLVPSLEALADEHPGSPFALVAISVSVLVGAGVGAVAGLERLSEMLRARRSSAAERRAQAAQAATSAFVLGALPALAMVALLLGSAAAREVYASTLGGWCATAMVGLTLAGQTWMEYVIWGRRAGAA